MTATAQETRCYKHYCRMCHTMEFVPVSLPACDDRIPRCCGEGMPYLGIVDAIPKRDESLKTPPR